MADMIDINPQRTAELKAHRDMLEPILRGLKDKVKTDLSAQAKSVLSGQIEVVQRRLNAVYAELAQIENTNMVHQALLDDGYPTAITDETIDPAILDELQREEADERAALAIFRPSMASALTVKLGPAEDKP